MCHVPPPHTHRLPTLPPPPLTTLLTSSLRIRPTALSSLLPHLPPGNTQEDHGLGVRAATLSQSLPLPRPQLPSCKEGEEDWRRYTIPKDPASSSNHTGLRTKKGILKATQAAPGGLGRRRPLGGKRGGGCQPGGMGGWDHPGSRLWDRM